MLQQSKNSPNGQMLHSATIHRFPSSSSGREGSAMVLLCSKRAHRTCNSPSKPYCALCPDWFPIQELTVLFSPDELLAQAKHILVEKVSTPNKEGFVLLLNLCKVVT
ncbi:hypothetical protein HanXRQr2_Chr04g0167981 [Helianthus annuus]|uniref:Uncharacterized protein n=1 Tax=Helianthus annuus TaxID=4232 RepID=A0A9K3J8L7_HELAN|nr:hypothetical protein HanXRQr2_Chr04g0167981 [Helianthus annuus]KAJ0931437.1 hypothetical protein HanPSC8_Chr04g0161641 [Helianthus annuus]